MRYWLGAALLFVLTVVWWFGGHTSPELPLAVEQTAPPQKHNPASNSGLKPILALPELKEQPAETFVTGLENLPASLRGTDVDGGFVLDEEGQLLPSFRTRQLLDRKSTRLNSSHVAISYAVFCLKKKTQDRR